MTRMNPGCKRRSLRQILHDLRLVLVAGYTTAQICRDCRGAIKGPDWRVGHFGPLCLKCATARYERTTGKPFAEALSAIAQTNELLGFSPS